MDSSNSTPQEDKKAVQADYRQLALGMMSYSAASTLGPLILFGFIGYLLDRQFQTSPIILIISVVLSFFVTMVMIFFKFLNLSKKLEEFNKTKEEDKQENNKI